MLAHAAGRWADEAAGDSRVEPFEKQRGVNRGHGRDDYGQFAPEQSNKPWVDKEKLGLDEVAEDRGVDVVRAKVQAKVEGGNPNGRYYDGLYKNPDGTYSAIEVKSGTAARDANQELFDSIVNNGTPARATLNGQSITITKVILKEVP